MTTAAADNLVQEFLDATEAGRETALLEALLSEHIEPLVRAVVWRRLGSSAVQDREDTAGEAMVELVGRLQSLRSGKSGRIGNFLGYVAVTTHHCCDHYLDAEPRLATTAPDCSERLDQQRALAAVWAEIRELPRPSQVALLLHLRDDRGSSVLPALVASGVASLRHIAAVLEWEAEELARMWRDLPLSDLEIASHLALQRQQVINLRKSARERLGRRLAGTQRGRKATGTGGNIRSISTSNKTEG